MTAGASAERPLEADSGSFRDPLSRVFVHANGEVWRALSTQAASDFDALEASDFYRQAVERGDLVGTERVAPGAITAPGDWAAMLRHERVEIITYPYEWSFEMLRDAALLQLALTRRALADGLITKDASAYNVQFVGTKPVFIDIGSFERLRGGEPWPGYRQFCELFLNPLLVQAVLDVPFQPFLRGSVHGIPTSTAAHLFRGRRVLDRTIATHVRLHARAERRYASADVERDVKSELARAGFGPRLIDAQLAGLERSVTGLRWKRQESTWSDYTDRLHYVGDDIQHKERFVAEAVEAVAPERVIDLGANDGRFSRVALRAGASLVVAVDSDHLVVDHLYRTLRQEGERRVLPLVVDLSDPSPGLGWRSRERMPFVTRVQPDLVLCLAVVHHLALTNTVPLEEIVAFLADFDAPTVVEFPHPDDVMAARLLARKRRGVFAAYNRDHWEQALAARMSVRRTETLPGGTRTMYWCEPR